jgi:predicted NUDIX family NTP pyrophosphohydrolase
MAVPRVSGGVLLYRRVAPGARLEVLLAHPGGPWFARRDAGHWTIPKGEPDPDEPIADAALREFAEETGFELPNVALIELGSIVQKGGKVVHAWAIEGDARPEEAHSNTIEIEWPPGSGTIVTIPEIDRVAWFDLTEARLRIKAAQIPLIDRLEAVLGLE